MTTTITAVLPGFSFAVLAHAIEVNYHDCHCCCGLTHQISHLVTVGTNAQFATRKHLAGLRW